MLPLEAKSDLSNKKKHKCKDQKRQH